MDYNDAATYEMIAEGNTEGFPVGERRHDGFYEEPEAHLL